MKTVYSLSTSVEMCAKISAAALGIIPIASGWMLDSVYVFPAPVCPYAMIVPLYPFSTSSTTGWTAAWYTSDWTESSGRICKQE